MHTTDSTTENNPYYDKNQRRMISSFVLFMDFLGVKKMWGSSEPSEIVKQLTFIDRYSEELANLTTPLKGGLLPMRPQVVTFSDNIAVTFPISEAGVPTLEATQPGGTYKKTQDDYIADNAAENAMLDAILDWVHFISDLADFQLKLAAEGYFLRGAFTFGPIFAEPGLIAGPALVEAAARESHVVQMPLIAAPDQVSGIRTIDSYGYGSSNHSSFDNIFSHTTFSHTKTEGESIFVNYLAASFGGLNLAPDTAKGDRNHLLEHRNAIIENLSHADECVLPKYIWLAEYHNWFCAKNSKTLADSGDDVLIPSSAIPDYPGSISFQTLKDHAISKVDGD